MKYTGICTFEDDFKSTVTFNDLQGESVEDAFEHLKEQIKDRPDISVCKFIPESEDSDEHEVSLHDEWNARTKIVSVLKMTHLVVVITSILVLSLSYHFYPDEYDFWHYFVSSLGSLITFNGSDNTTSAYIFSIGFLVQGIFFIVGASIALRHIRKFEKEKSTYRCIQCASDELEILTLASVMLIGAGIGCLLTAIPYGISIMHSVGGIIYMACVSIFFTTIIWFIDSFCNTPLYRNMVIGVLITLWVLTALSYIFIKDFTPIFQKLSIMCYIVCSMAFIIGYR